MNKNRKTDSFSSFISGIVLIHSLKFYLAFGSFLFINLIFSLYAGNPKFKRHTCEICENILNYFREM